MSSNSKIQLVEDAYRLEREPEAWLREFGASLRHASEGIVSCYAFDVSRVDGRMRLGRHWAEDPLVAEQLRHVFAEAPGELLDLFYRQPLRVQTAGEVLTSAGLELHSTMLPEAYRPVGIADVFALAAVDPSGFGTVLGMGLDNPRGPSDAERIEWTHVAAHVAAGARLRRRLDGAAPIDHADAILRTDGKLELASSPDARLAGAAELLREAVTRIELARSNKRSAPAALELWQALVDGQWSLVDHFEGDSRRYYVAVRNAPNAVRSRALTRREAEVVAFLASGAGTKATAYALGLDVVTVRGYLRAAMAKLGVRSRAELIGLRAMLLDSEPEQGDN